MDFDSLSILTIQSQKDKTKDSASFICFWYQDVSDDKICGLDMWFRGSFGQGRVNKTTGQSSWLGREYIDRHIDHSIRLSAEVVLTEIP